MLLFILTFFSLNFYLYGVVVFSIAFIGGFFQVPSLAIVQQSNLERKLGDMVAYLNMVTFIFVLFGTFLFWLGTFLSNENSYVVFGSIFAVSVLVGIYFLSHSPVFYRETVKILSFGKKKDE